MTTSKDIHIIRPSNPHEDRYFLRLNLHERIQHHVTWSTFVVLAVTGFMVEFPENWIAAFGPYRETVFYWRGIIHRIAAVIMMINMIYQPWYFTCTADGRKYFLDMLPTLKDLRDVKQNMAYYLGLSSEKPLFDRFNYKEKLEFLTGWLFRESEMTLLSLEQRQVNIVEN